MKNFSGKFVLRIPPDLHSKLARMGSAQRLSLNQVCLLLLHRGLSATSAGQLPAFESVVKKLKAKFKEDLAGVVLFGSQATGEATSSSDIDILIVLGKGVELTRALYTWWNDNVSWTGGEMNPHFVIYPDDVSSVTGLWFEVALSGKIIYQQGTAVEQFFTKLKKYIADGKIRRYISNGHPYWVRKAINEK